VFAFDPNTSFETPLAQSGICKWKIRAKLFD
jgi:hypothetical protein